MLTLLAALSIGFLMLIVTLRVQYDRRRAYENHLKDLWEPMVIAYLSDEVSAVDITAAVGDGRRAKDIFARLISEYLTNLRGEERDKLVVLASSTGLTSHELDALRKNAPWRQAVAAVRLGLMGDRRAIPALRDSLYDRSPLVQIASADALATLEDIDSLEPVAGVVLTQTEWNRLKTAEILVAYAKIAPARLLPFAFDVSIPASRRALVIEALGDVNYRQAESALIEYARRDVESELKAAVVKYAGLVTALESVDFLIEKTADDDWLIRSQAAKSLGAVADPSAVPVLVTLTRDPVWWVRYHSARALANILPEGLMALEEIATAAPDRFASDIADQALYEAGEWQERAA